MISTNIETRRKRSASECSTISSSVDIGRHGTSQLSRLGIRDRVDTLQFPVSSVVIRKPGFQFSANCKIEVGVASLVQLHGWLEDGHRTERFACRGIGGIDDGWKTHIIDGTLFSSSVITLSTQYQNGFFDRSVSVKGIIQTSHLSLRLCFLRLNSDIRQQRFGNRNISGHNDRFGFNAGFTIHRINDKTPILLHIHRPNREAALQYDTRLCSTLL